MQYYQCEIAGKGAMKLHTVTKSKIDYVLKSCTFSEIFSPLSIKAKNKSRCKMNTNYKKKFL